MTTARSSSGTAPPVRKALVQCLVVGAFVTALSAALGGVAGLLGGLVGVGVVLLFFGFGHLALTQVRDVDPALFFVVALLTYALQVLALLAVLGAVAAWSTDVSVPALAGSIIGCTLAWTVGLVVAARRQRIPLYDLGDGPS